MWPHATHMYWSRPWAWQPRASQAWSWTCRGASSWLSPWLFYGCEQGLRKAWPNNYHVRHVGMIRVQIRLNRISNTLYMYTLWTQWPCIVLRYSVFLQFRTRTQLFYTTWVYIFKQWDVQFVSSFNETGHKLDSSFAKLDIQFCKTGYPVS
jgi:hypothetical protein